MHVSPVILDMIKRNDENLFDQQTIPGKIKLIGKRGEFFGENEKTNIS